MQRSLGMTAYRTYAKRLPDRSYTPRAPRPAGTLVWIHAAEPGNPLAIEDLALRLCTTLHDVSVLITVTDQSVFEQAKTYEMATPRINLCAAPSEHPDAVETFLAHWCPDVCIWTWGALRPNLVTNAQAEGCVFALIDADANGFDSSHNRWFPDMTRQLLDPFVSLMARSDDGVKRLVRAGLKADRIDLTPPLQPGGNAMPCNDGDLTELRAALGARYVWFACHVQDSETDVVLAAHKRALQMAHRLLLILHPAQPDAAPIIKTKLGTQSLRCANWSEGDTVDDSVQVLLGLDAADLGLFYRSAPITLMGSSLKPGHTGRNPYEAAALGSAVLYGPHTGPYLPFYSALASAGAARVVKDAETLRAAVSALVAPEQAAAMAHAGWDIVSRGARLTDRVVDLVQAVLDDELGTAHARP